MGRPPKNKIPRSERLSLRLSEDELKDIDYLSKKMNISRTDVIVKAIDMFKDKTL